MIISAMLAKLHDGTLDSTLLHLYGEHRLDQQKQRYEKILQEGIRRFGDVEAILVSAPGRTEVGGNHTDHQLGRVLAASIDLDALAVVVPTDDNTVSYAADAFAVAPVVLDDLAIRSSEVNTSAALIRGIADGLKKKGYAVGGFKAYAESDVLPGSGMSSSAAFEILIAKIFSLLYNDDRVDPVEQAKIGQYAENVYFGKASGLMDQTACAVGGFAAIDFADKENPVVEKVDFDFDASGLSLVLTDCRQSHAELSDEYSKMPAEMKAVAKVLGHEVLSQCSLADLIANARTIREQCGDRAFLRAFHFFHETERAKKEKEALAAKDTDRFLQLVIESGESSFMFLQNVYPPNDSKHESLAVGLALSQELLKGKGGAWRVHGGGFAGTIQAFVPNSLVEIYKATMEHTFGEGCCYVLRIRDCGGVKVA